MKVLALNGSVNPDGSTGKLIRLLLTDLGGFSGKIEAEIVDIGSCRIEPCRVKCRDYCGKAEGQCIIEDDAMSVFRKMKEADALIIGAPQYFRAPPAVFHTFVERLISQSYYQENMGLYAEKPPLEGKPCALIGVAEYSNPVQILEYLTDFCLLMKMEPLRLKSFPYYGIGGQGDIGADAIFRPLDRCREMALVISKK